MTSTSGQTRRRNPPASSKRRRPGSVAPLPEFIEPMLATMGSEPFDGDENWLFEIKWDGFRALCRRDKSECRLIGRHRTDYSPRFPALIAILSRLPAGTLLDGEIVALKQDGTHDFTALLRRAGRRRTLAFVAFDILYADGQSVMQLPCIRRRKLLGRLIATLSNPQVIASQGVIGDGVAYFRQAISAGLEGVVAKRINASYHPGVRTGDWIKLKARKQLLAVIIGYTLNESGALKSLVIAAAAEDGLKCVGRVGSGIAPALASQLLERLTATERADPIVPCSGIKARWVEPALRCRVSFAEKLASGRLRQPVLEEVTNM